VVKKRRLCTGFAAQHQKRPATFVEFVQCMRSRLRPGPGSTQCREQDRQAVYEGRTGRANQGDVCFRTVACSEQIGHRKQNSVRTHPSDSEGLSRFESLAALAPAVACHRRPKLTIQLLTIEAYIHGNSTAYGSIEMSRPYGVAHSSRGQKASSIVAILRDLVLSTRLIQPDAHTESRTNPAL
jgi:hypothetical protein